MTSDPDIILPAADWEAFYRDYRKPGYVSGYEISSKLGGGMFGLVFKAQKQSIGKDYAIKFLKVDDGEVRRAVLQELQQVQHFAQVDHPNLVAIEDRGEVDGIPYLVMSYAGQQTLRDLLPCGPEQRSELLNYFLQACRGVAALHERSLVHFDLKPANVFLKGGVARVGDYGLSKLVAHSGGSLSMGRGTPYYMAPEVLQRRGDQRSDIYSLGVMLYEILVGELPFRGDSEWEVLRKHEQQQPEFPPALPRHQRLVIERCLCKDPTARYPRVEDLIAAMGAERSAAAAAYPEVSHAAAPPLPPPLPPPRPGQEDPYLGLRRAARDAAAHAGKIARSAVSTAGKAVREAVQAAREQRHELHRRRRDERAARKALAREQRRAARRTGSRLGGIGLVVAGVFLFGVWMPLRDVRQVQRGPTALASQRLQGEIEPQWVSVGSVDPQRGSELLAEHLGRIAGDMPGRVAADATGSTGITAAVDPAQQQRLHDLVWRFANSREYDANAAARLGTRQALFVASQQLETLSLATASGLDAARNLQRLLEETTGYHAISLVDAPGMPPELRAKANAGLGRMWRAFLSVAAGSDHAWQVYRQLRR